MLRRAYVPAVDVVDSEAEAVLVVDIPGVPEGGVDLSMEKNVLTLTAMPADGVIAGRTHANSEHGAGEYRRSFALPDEVDRERIEASLKNGVLRVRLPKRAPAMKKISVVAN
jgi:HSP20 family molecular chaperone IbpA